MKNVTGNHILRILKTNGLAANLPEAKINGNFPNRGFKADFQEDIGIFLSKFAGSLWLSWHAHVTFPGLLAMMLLIASFWRLQDLYYLIKKAREHSKLQLHVSLCCLGRQSPSESTWTRTARTRMPSSALSWSRAGSTDLPGASFWMRPWGSLLPVPKSHEQV